MNALPVFRNLTSIILAACCAIGIATAHSQTYVLTDLGVLPDETASIPAAVNRQGQVTGTSGESAFRSDSGALMQDIGTPDQTQSRGFAISGSGQVAGDSTFGESEVSHAALFGNGSARDLAACENPELFSRANGINASGQVVGIFQSRSNGEYGRAFITNSFESEKCQTLTDLGTLGGPYAQALAINDSGLVTGNADIYRFFTLKRRGMTHAFVWSVQTNMRDLGTLGGDYSYGTGINSNNHVAGYSTINGVDNRIHAFLHDGVTMRDLGSLDGSSEASDRSFGLGVNSADQVVGFSYVPSVVGIRVYPPDASPFQQVAFVYTGGVMRDLNTLIENNAQRYRLYSATGINDKGQITAIAMDASSNAFHAVLLTPSLDILAKPGLIIRKSGKVLGSNVPAVELLKTSLAISAK
jgi:probable HAF family extracellular repeat protein